MIDGSRWADRELGDPADSSAHAMRDGRQGQTGEEAEGCWAGWIERQLSTASEWNSAWHFGVAGHAIADSFAPSHAGFQPWNGVAGVAGVVSFSGHYTQEMGLFVLTSIEEEEMLHALREAYFETFGSEAYTDATGYLYSRTLSAPTGGLPTYTPTPPSAD